MILPILIFPSYSFSLAVQTVKHKCYLSTEILKVDFTGVRGYF